MREPHELLADIERIVGDTNAGDGQIQTNLTWDTVDEARTLAKQLVLMQKELRLVKKEAGQSIAEIRSAFVAQRTDIKPGFFSSAFLGGRGSARYRQSQRENLRQSEAQARAGYDQVVRAVDQLLFQIDGAKLRVDESIRAAKAEEALAPKPARQASPALGPGEQLRRLKGLLDEGLISQEEFDAKRREILARM